MIKINFFDGKEALEFDCETIKEAVEKAIKQNIDLRHADLRYANLTGSALDYSCLPLWCGSLDMKIDKRIFCQLLYHVVRAGQSIDDKEVKKLMSLKSVKALANQFHRVAECGEIE